ncbi:MAG: hypothetical protein K8963_09355 [Proteobacteria bacterium]|nr:hypothetical protein [Pseudomonadota bacterium]
MPLHTRNICQRQPSWHPASLSASCPRLASVRPTPLSPILNPPSLSPALLRSSSLQAASWRLVLAAVLALCSVGPVALQAEQREFFRGLKDSTWQYTVGFRDSQRREHTTYFQLRQRDVAEARTILQKPESLHKTIQKFGEDNRRQLEVRLAHYADDLWADVMQRTHRHADTLMLALPSGSRIHVTTTTGGQYKFTSDLVRDYRFWKFDEYNNIMQQSLQDLQLFFQMQIAEHRRAVEIYRDDLQRELQNSVDAASTQLMSQGLIVKNDYNHLKIDYREAVRRSLWHLSDLSYSLDSIGSDRDRVDKVMGFFQSIPYEAIQDKRHANSALGFRMPAVTIDQNLGDCDSKAVGMAAVLKNLMPHRRVLLVLVPGHAFLAMQLTPHAGDDLIHYAGSQWVLLEPVGPGLFKVGTISRSSRALLKAGLGISYVEL